jgi:hypothetical protein
VSGGLSDGVPCPAGVDLVGLDPSAADGERTTVEGVLRSGAIDPALPVVDHDSPPPAL